MNFDLNLVDLSTLAGLKDGFNQEILRFNMNAIDSVFIPSYFNNSVNEKVREMASRANASYMQLVHGYSAISTWWSEYASNVAALEDALVDGNAAAISEGSVSAQLHNLHNLSNYNMSFFDAFDGTNQNFGMYDASDAVTTPVDNPDVVTGHTSLVSALLDLLGVNSHDGNDIGDATIVEDPQTIVEELITQEPIVEVIPEMVTNTRLTSWSTASPQERNDILNRAEEVLWKDRAGRIPPGFPTPSYSDIGSYKNIPEAHLFEVVDLRTGLSFTAAHSYGSRHMDWVPASPADNDVIKEIGHSWNHRPVLIIYDNNVTKATMHTMPHGYGLNDNGMNGHACVHFRGSTTHAQRADGSRATKNTATLRTEMDNLIDARIIENNDLISQGIVIENNSYE